MAGAMIGAIIGSAAGGDASSGMASAAQYQASKHERNIAWRRAQQWAMIGPSLQMEGLRRAGLNPILAASGGLGSARMQEPSMASTGGSPSFSRDTGSRVVSALQARQQMQKQDRIMDAQVAEAQFRAQLAGWEAAAAKYLPEKAMHSVWSEAMLSSLREAQVGETMASRLGILASTARQVMDTRLRGYEEPALKATAELYERFPWLRQVGAGTEELGGAVRSFLTRGRRR